MKNVPKKAVAVAGMIVLAGTVLFTFAQSRKDRSVKKALKKIIPIESQVSVLNGQTVIAMTSQAQKLTGITTKPLKKISARKHVTVPAMILSVDGLAKLRNGYVAAVDQLAKAHAREHVSGKEYARMKSLYQNNRNVSQKALQSAEGAWRSDQADVHAAKQELQLKGMEAGQKWGSVVEQWVADGTPTLDRVLNQQTLLVEVTLSAGKSSGYPARIQLKLPDGKRSRATFVSLFPRVDPRIQGVAMLYRTSARAGLAPGTNLVAHYAVGRKTSGVVVPRSAVVWWHGKAWIYKVRSPGSFTRRAVPTDTSVRGGWFVARGFEPGESVVTHGAEQLLAIEISPTRSSSADGGGD